MNLHLAIAENFKLIALTFCFLGGLLTRRPGWTFVLGVLLAAALLFFSMSGGKTDQVTMSMTLGFGSMVMMIFWLWLALATWLGAAIRSGLMKLASRRSDRAP